MTLLLLAAALPGLFWDQGPQTAPSLRQAGISRIFVSASQVDAWKSVPGIKAEAADPEKATKLPPPGVNYRVDEASASRLPWIDSNGWRFLRNPAGRFYYNAPGKQAALAAAEAFSYAAAVLIQTDADGIQPLGEMLAYLARLGAPPGEPIADFGVIDDGSPASGEALNLLVRHNLLFRIIPEPDKRLKMTVRLSSLELKDPGVVAQKIRADLTDDRRTIRIYGSPVVIAGGWTPRSAAGPPASLRVHLLNYAGATRTVRGLRVRVLGRYQNHTPGLLDYTADSGATEFTIPELKIYTAIDLKQ